MIGIVVLLSAVVGVSALFVLLNLSVNSQVNTTEVGVLLASSIILVFVCLGNPPQDKASVPTPEEVPTCQYSY